MKSSVTPLLRYSVTPLLRYSVALLLCCWSHSFAQQLLLEQSHQALHEASSITVECYANFLASTPDADNYYDPATMHDQIERIAEDDHIVYCIVEGEQHHPMSGLTDLEIELYNQQTEIAESTSAPLMMFGLEAKDDQRKTTIQMSGVQRQRQRDVTSGSTASSSSSARASSMSNVSEKTPLLNKGNSSSSILQEITVKKTAPQAQIKSSAQAPILSVPVITKAKLPFDFFSSTQKKDRVPFHLGTPEERQSLLRSSTRSSTTWPAERVVPTHFSQQQRRTDAATALLTQSEGPSVRPITRIEDVHQIDDLFNTTHWTTSAKEKEQPNFDGIAPQSLCFPLRMKAYLFSDSLGRKLTKDFRKLRKEQDQIQKKTTPLLRPPTDDSQIPKFLEQTERWIEAQKEITELSVHFLNRVIHVQDNKAAQVNALSPHFFTAVKNVWINEVHYLLETHKRVMAVEALSSKFEKLSYSSFLTNSIERMRKWSDYDVKQFLRKGEGYIYLCEKKFFNNINDRNSRLNLLQLSLTMKEQLEGLRKIALANDQLYLAKTAIFTPFGESPVAFIDPSRKQELITAAKQARNEAYRSYQRPVFNRQQELISPQSDF